MLTPNDAGCELAYTVNAQVGGKIAQLGQRLIDGAAKSMAEDFFKRFDAEMQRRYPAPAAAETVPGAAIPVAGVSVKDASGKTPTWIWVVGGTVLAALAMWMLR